jgi:hypothetical protein
MSLPRILAFVVLLFLSAVSVFATDYTFTGKATAPYNHDWSQPENWSPASGPPGEGDTAIIGTSSNGFTVYVDFSPTIIDSVTIIASVLQGGGSLQVNTSMECQDAQLSPGSIIVNGTFEVDPVPQIPVYRTTTVSCPMTLNGSSVVSSNATLEIGNGFSVINNRDLTLDDGSDLIVDSDAGGSFVNNALLSVPGGLAIVSTGSAVFSNAPSGVVTVSGGARLNLEGTFDDSGALDPLDHGLIVITADTAFHNEAAFVGDGMTVLAGGKHTLDGTVLDSGSLQMGTNSVPVLTLDGTLEVAPEGNFEWLGGTLTGVETNVTGAISIDTNAVMDINNLNGLTLRNVIVTNNGFINWMDSGTLFMGYNAQIINNAFFIAFADGGLQPLAGGTSGYGIAFFDNTQGIFEKQIGSTNSNAATTIGVPFYGGEVRVYNGNLWFTAGGGISLWEVGSDATIQLKAGSYGLPLLGGEIDGLAGYGVGPVYMNSGVTLTISEIGALFIEGGELIQNGGTISGSQSYLVVENGGLFVWNGGTITNIIVSIETNSVMDISGGTIKTMLGTTITNAGTVNWTNANSVGSISAGDDVVLDNAGQFNIGCDSYFNDVSTNLNTRPVLTNEVTGVITKAGTTGTSAVGIELINLGEIIAVQGNLELGPMYDLAGLDLIDLEGGKITFDDPTVLHGNVEGSGVITANAGLTFSGDEVEFYLIILNGNITNDGTFVLFYGAPGDVALQGGSFNQTAHGTLIIPIRGSNATNKDFGQITLAGANPVTLGGALIAYIIDGYAPPVGATFPVLTSFQRTGTFTNVVLPQGMAVNYTSGGATLVVTSTVPAQIIPPALTNGQFTFGFNTITNRSYTVQFKNDLSDATWTFLTNFTGDGTLWQLPPSDPLAPQRFFRVSNP